MSTKLFEIPVAALDIGYFSVKGASRREGDQVKVFNFPSQASRTSVIPVTTIGIASISGALVNVKNESYFVGQDVVLQSSASQTQTITDGFVKSADHIYQNRNLLLIARAVLSDYKKSLKYFQNGKPK